MIFKRLYCDIYNAHVLFYTECTQEEFIDHINKKYNILIEDDYSDCLGITMQANTEERTYYIIWVRNLNDTQTLVHEVLHLTYKILDDRGVVLSNDNNEAVAYYLSFWFKKLYLIGIKKGDNNAHT